MKLETGQPLGVEIGEPNKLGAYDIAVTLPECDISNAEVQFIRTSADWIPSMIQVNEYSVWNRR